jgi:hypothetical protein
MGFGGPKYFCGRRKNETRKQYVRAWQGDDYVVWREPRRAFAAVEQIAGSVPLERVSFPVA